MLAVSAPRSPRQRPLPQQPEVREDDGAVEAHRRRGARPAPTAPSSRRGGRRRSRTRTARPRRCRSRRRPSDRVARAAARRRAAAAGPARSATGSRARRRRCASASSRAAGSMWSRHSDRDSYRCWSQSKMTVNLRDGRRGRRRARPRATSKAKTHSSSVGLSLAQASEVDVPDPMNTMSPAIAGPDEPGPARGDAHSSRPVSVSYALRTSSRAALKATPLTTDGRAVGRSDPALEADRAGGAVEAVEERRRADGGAAEHVAVVDRGRADEAADVRRRVGDVRRPQQLAGVGVEGVVGAVLLAGAEHLAPRRSRRTGSAWRRSRCRRRAGRSAGRTTPAGACRGRRR